MCDNWEKLIFDLNKLNNNDSYTYMCNENLMISKVANLWCTTISCVNNLLLSIVNRGSTREYSQCRPLLVFYASFCGIPENKITNSTCCIGNSTIFSQRLPAESLYWAKTSQVCILSLFNIKLKIYFSNLYFYLHTNRHS